MSWPPSSSVLTSLGWILCWWKTGCHSPTCNSQHQQVELIFTKIEKQHNQFQMACDDLQVATAGAGGRRSWPWECSVFSAVQAEGHRSAGRLCGITSNSGSSSAQSSFLHQRTGRLTLAKELVPEYVSGMSLAVLSHTHGVSENTL